MSLSYGLVTEQKRGAYKYFIDLGHRMEVADSRTAYLDEVPFRILRPRNGLAYLPHSLGSASGGRPSQNIIWRENGQRSGK